MRKTRPQALILHKNLRRAKIVYIAWIAALVVFAGWLGCSSDPSFSRDPGRFQKQILRIVSPGENLDLAKAKLEGRGFMSQEPRFGALFGNLADGETYDNINYVPFVLRTKEGGLLWIVALTFEGDSTEDATVDSVLVQFFDRRNYFR